MKPKKMKSESKGNFIDFCVAGSTDVSLTKAALVQYYKQGITAEGLLEWFQKRGYHGVSLEDCEKLLKVTRHLPCDFDQQY